MPSEFINNPMMQFQIEVNKFVTFTNTAQSLYIYCLGNTSFFTHIKFLKIKS